MSTAALRALLSSTRRIALSSSRVYSRSLSSVSVPLSRNAINGVRSFSVSTRRGGEGTSDVSLAQKLSEELQFEKQAAAEAGTGVPEFLEAFQKQDIWKIEDVLGNDEVILTRKFGNENLRLMFSIEDLRTPEDEFDENLPNEDAEEGEGGEDGEGTNSGLHAYGIRVSLSLTKTNGPGALNVDMVCQEGHFMVDNISFYHDAKLGTELTAEADWKRRGLYLGPQFDTLDVAVQEEFEKFLQERGVNESIALFIPEYAEWKEQTEYTKWLESVKSFVEL